MAAIKMFFTLLASVLLFWDNLSVSQVIRSSIFNEHSTSKKPNQTSTPWSSYAIKPSPIVEPSNALDSILAGSRCQNMSETKSVLMNTRTMNRTESFITAATRNTMRQTLSKSIRLSSFIKATSSTRKTASINSRSIASAPHISFSQRIQMTSTTISESLGMTISVFTFVQPSRTTTIKAQLNSRQANSFLDVRGSKTKSISSSLTSAFANASLSNNTSSTYNRTEDVYRRPIDDYSLVFYSIAFVIGISGNAFVFVDAFKTQKKLKTNEILLIHLCVVNVFILSTLTPMVFLMKMGVYDSCHVIFSLTILYQYSIVYTLTAISFQHHRAIACPFSPKPSCKRLASIVFAIWVLSILLVLPMVLTDELLPRGCLLHKKNPLKLIRRKIYYSLLTFTQYLLPFLLIVIHYTKLSMFLKKVRLEVERRSDSTREVQSPRKKRDKRVVMVIVSMVATFAVCMLPQQVQFILTEFVLENSLPFGAAVFTFYPVVIKACIDPLVYGAVGRKLKSRCCRRPTSSTQNEHVN